MIVETRKLCNVSQETVANGCNIDRKRYMKIGNNRCLPDPHELIIIDRFLKQDGKLIMNYCSCHCPAGKQIGLTFEEIPPLLARRMQVMKFLRDAEQTRPELEDILSNGTIGQKEHDRFSKICEKYHNLTKALISLVMHKEKVTCVGAQATLRN